MLFDFIFLILNISRDKCVFRNVMSSILSYPGAPLTGVLEFLYTSTPAEIREFLYVTYATVTSIDEFQIKILRVLIIVLCINLLFISISWGKYGEKITERFMKPGEFQNHYEISSVINYRFMTPKFLMLCGFSFIPLLFLNCEV